MIRNFAILAHVDAGKTTLSEHMLFMAGEVNHPGFVDDGLATLDYLPEEKAKGITIEAGLSTFHWKDRQYNLLDTPGHIDFGIEVDLALEAVEAAILVVSGTGGVETQTVSAWRKLRERGILTLIFINKLDHPDSRLDDVLMEVEERLDVRPVLLNAPIDTHAHSGMLDVITNSIVRHDARGKETVVEHLDVIPEALLRLRTEASEFASGADDALLEELLSEKEITGTNLVRGLKALLAKGTHAACYCGSALQCRGIRQLMTALGLFFPEPPAAEKNILGTVVRIRHNRDGSEYSLFKSNVNLAEAKWPKGFRFSRVSAELFEPVQEIRFNDIYAMHCEVLETTLGMKIGMDGKPKGEAQSLAHYRKDAYHPLLHSRIECVQAEDWPRVDRFLQLLMRSDPSIHVQADTANGGWILQTVGEVQLEVMLSRMQRELHCPVSAGQPQVVFYEQLRGTLGPRRNTFQAPDGRSLEIEITVELDSSLHTNEVKFLCELDTPTSEAIESALHECCAAGVRGVGSMRATKIKIHHWNAPKDIPIPWINKVCADVFSLLVKPDELEIFEPYMLMELNCVPDYAGNLIGDLQARGGKVREIGGDGKNVKILLDIPLQRVFGYSTIGRSISKGTASYALRYTGHRSLQA